MDRLADEYELAHDVYWEAQRLLQTVETLERVNQPALQAIWEEQRALGRAMNEVHLLIVEMAEFTHRQYALAFANNER